MRSPTSRLSSQRLRYWEDDFSEAVAQGAPDLRIPTLFEKYMMTVNEQATVDAMAEFLAPMGDEVKELPMTLAERLKEEGLQEGLQEGLKKGLKKGRQEGRLKEKVEVARKALAKGMSPADLAELTDLPLEEVQQLAH